MLCFPAHLPELLDCSQNISILLPLSGQRANLQFIICVSASRETVNQMYCTVLGIPISQTSLPTVPVQYLGSQTSLPPERRVPTLIMCAPARHISSSIRRQCISRLHSVAEMSCAAAFNSRKEKTASPFAMFGRPIRSERYPCRLSMRCPTTGIINQESGP